MKDYFLNVKLEQCDFDQGEISPKGMVRIIASGNTFYFNEEDFTQSQTFLKRLKLGDELKICAELLKDGSFWVQWIAHSTKGRLEPERTFTLTTKQKKWLFIALISTVIGSWWTYFSLMTLDFNFLLVISTILAIGFVIAGTSYMVEKIYFCFKLLRPKHKKRLKALDSVLANKYSILSDGIQLIIPKIKQPILEKLIINKKSIAKFKQSQVKRIRGKINIHHVDRVTIYQRGSNYSLTKTLFQIDNIPFILSYRDRYFYSDHNLFMANGDDIELFYWQSPNNSSTPVILGVYNHTDGGAYTITAQAYISHQQAKNPIMFAFGATTAFVFSIFAFFAISEVYEKGNYWDKWDWLSIGDTFLGMGIIFTVIMSGIMFLILLFSNLYIVFSAKGMSSYQTYFLLQEQRMKREQSLYITGLSL